MRELFVYYRVREDVAAQARGAVGAMQRALGAAHPGLIARLLSRCEADGGATWMETYALEPSSESTGIDAQIEASIAGRATALWPFIDGPRHVEIFDSEPML
jgi:hypothetical protein